MNFCPHCGAAATVGAYCAHCGGALRPPGAQATPVVALHGKPAVTTNVAIVAILLNVIVWPGLGSLVAGEKVGWAQGFLFLFGLPLALVLVGIPMLIGAWIWALVTGIELLRRAQEAERAQAAVLVPPPAR